MPILVEENGFQITKSFRVKKESRGTPIVSFGSIKKLYNNQPSGEIQKYPYAASIKQKNQVRQ